MKVLLMVIIATLSISSLCCLFHATYKLYRAPRWFYDQFMAPVIDPHLEPYWKKIYLGAVMIGFGVIVYSGIKQLLFFIPLGWGYFNEVGELIPIVEVFSGLVAIYSLLLFDTAKRYVILNIQNENRK